MVHALKVRCEEELRGDEKAQRHEDDDGAYDFVLDLPDRDGQDGETGRDVRFPEEKGGS